MLLSLDEKVRVVSSQKISKRYCSKTAHQRYNLLQAMVNVNNNRVVVLGPPQEVPTEEISIIIPPKPGEEDDYQRQNHGGKPMMKTMAVCSMSIANIGEQETNLPSSKLPFSLKLFEMLEDVYESRQDDIVSWVDNGRGFKVHDMDRFVQEIIPSYFKQSKYKSFQRQLYFYGFIRQAKGPLAGSYFHPNFRRDKKFLCLSLTTKKAANKFSAAATVAASSGKGKAQNDTKATATVSHNEHARNDTARRVSHYDGDSFIRQSESPNTEMRTTAPSPAPPQTTTATTKHAPSVSSIVPRVSIDYKDVRGRMTPHSYCFDGSTEEEYLYDYYGYHIRHDHHYYGRQRSHDQRRNPDQRHSTFYAREGDTCRVFDDMTFYYVEHGG